MANLVGSILRKATRKDRLNILEHCVHERYQQNLAKTGHNFYCIRGSQNLKDWEIKYAPIPSNYHLLNSQKGDNQIPIEIDFDLAISHHKFGAFQVMAPIAKQLNIPLISLEHTGPVPSWPQEYLLQLKQMQGNLNLFISEWSREKWGWNNDEAKVIYHGIDTEIFKPKNITKKSYILSVVNEFEDRDWCCGFELWNRVTQDLPRHHIGFSKKGFSQPAKSIEELVNFYNECTVFVNTSIVSPVPTVLMEAMSCGVLVVSTANCSIPEIIKNGYNGFITNNENDMRNKLIEILENPNKFEEIKINARNTILERFSLNSFVKNWNIIFDECINK